MPSKTSSHELLAPAILDALQLAIFERREDGLFRTLGARPEWLEDILPTTANADAVDIADVFPFLELFLADSVEAIRADARMQSDVWTQRDHQNQERHLQAVAFEVGGRFVLIIESPTAEYQERSIAQQRSHDVQLQAERIERMRRELADLNEQLKKRNEEVERATRAKSNFLAATSHEIRTPMNAIIGMADLLQQTSLTAEQRKYVDVFQAAGENLLALINDILDLSKVEAGKVELESIDFDLPDLVSQVVEIVQVRAKPKGLAVSHRIEPEVPRGLVGDPNRLRQVLINLLGNSVKFTESGGVDITVEVDPNSRAPGRLHFVIADTGIGIPVEKLGTIFESFGQADSSTTRKYGGTGLGLSISRKLIALMQGQIWVESQLGIGTKFHFVAQFGLRVDQQAASAGRSGNETVTSELLGDRQAASIVSGLRILLADDSEDNRFLILSYLKGSGCIIDIAENGRVAVEKFETGKYDLVLMDVEMPEMDGYTAAGLIRNLQRNERHAVPILALTAHAFRESITKSLEAGFTDHLTKPIRRVTLLDAIRKYAPEASVKADLGSTRVLIDPELQDLVPGFLNKRRKDAQALADAIAVADYETVRKLGHNLKGTGAGYGFKSISDLGAQIEEAAKLQDAARIRDKVEELSLYLSAVEWIPSSDLAEG